jgi:predicted ATPase
MFSVVDYLACHQEHFYARAASRNISPLAEISDHSPLVYLEEPEAHVFPKTQYDLVKLFGWLAKDSIIAFDWVITTHSPYILSAFGNLLKAGKVGAQSAENHAAVEKTVAEKYWIKNSDFAAYKIENGALTSIFDKETGQIDGDYLDNVSSDIAEEFGQLLEIQYGG